MYIPKLDRYTRQRIETEFRKRHEAELLSEFETIKTKLVRHVQFRIAIKYGPMQPDMPTLAKYNLAHRIRGVNLRVYNPETRLYDETVGIEIETTLFAPEHGCKAYGAEETTCTVSDYVRADDTDYADFWSAIEFRRALKDRQTTEQTEFAAAIRETTSLRVLCKRFPWIGDLFNLTTEAA